MASGSELPPEPTDLRGGPPSIPPAGAPGPAGRALPETLPGTTGPDGPAEIIDGRYRVLRVLGKGGFGIVYLVADQLYENEQRALKVVLAEHAHRPEFGERFRNEIRITRALAHPGIPRIFNDGRTAGGDYYFTMEFVEGRLLSDVLAKSGTLPPLRIVRLVRQMLAILDYAHAQGVVHRDLKPSNIMLLDEGTDHEKVKVLDFGIAKVLKKEGLLQGALTQNTTEGLGTPHYMSPEQVQGTDIDAKTDLYALGIIIYQMCSGKLPFSGKTVNEVATARLLKKPTPLAASDAPDSLRAVVMQLLEKEKERRPPTKELLDRLTDLELGQQRLFRSLRRLAVGVAGVAVIVGAFSAPWSEWFGGGGTNGDRPLTNGPEGPGEPPVTVACTISSPPAGSFVKRDGVVIAGTATGLARIGARSRSGQDLGEADVDPSGSFTITLGPLDEGRRTIELVDPAAGAVLSQVEFRVDSLRPEIVLATDVAQSGLGAHPSRGPGAFVTRADRIALRGRVSDHDSGSAFTLVVVDRTTGKSDEVPLDASGKLELQRPMPESGSLELRVRARDEAGNESDETFLSIWADRVAPAFEILEPSGKQDVARFTSDPIDADATAVSITVRDRALEPGSIRVESVREGKSVALTSSEPTRTADSTEIVLSGELAVRAPESQYRITAVDAAGNEATMVLALARAAAFALAALEPDPKEQLPPWQESIELVGRATRALADVAIASDRAAAPFRAEIDGTTFRSTLPLSFGPNEFELTFTDSGGRKITLQPVSWTRAAPRPISGFDPAPDARIVAGAGRYDRIVSDRGQVPFRFVAARDGSSEPGFYLSETEITRAQYERYTMASGAKLPAGPTGRTPSPDEPIVNVSSKEARQLCLWIGSRTRLPTIAEWEHAAGDATYPWGAEWRDGICHAAQTAAGARPRPVAEFPDDRSPAGLLGMGGNVSEWCITAPKNTTPVMKGGNFASSREQCARSFIWPQGRIDEESRDDRTGFRALLEID